MKMSDVKDWLRQSNSDLSEQELEELADDVKSYLKFRIERLSQKKNVSQQNNNLEDSRKLCIECNEKVVSHHKSYFCEDCLPKFYGEPKKDKNNFEKRGGRNEKV